MFGLFKKKRKPEDMPENTVVDGCWNHTQHTRWVHKVNGKIYYLDSPADNPREAKIDYWKPRKGWYGKTVPLILITLGIFGCEAPDLIEPMQVSKPILVDSIVGYRNCQTIIMRTYYTYHNGEPSQAIHTREVIGKPCFEANRQPINTME